MIVFVAAAAFGAKLWRKPPTDFTLPPAIDQTADASSLGSALADTDDTTDRSAFGKFGGAVVTYNPTDPLIGTSSRSADAAAPLGTSRQAAAVSRWTPWGLGSSRRNSNEGGSSSGSASLGGLWHTMSPFGHNGTTADTAVVARNDPGVKLSTKPKAADPAPRAPRPSAGGGSSSGGGSSAGGGSSSGGGDPAAPGAGLGEDETPPSNPSDPLPGGSGDPTPGRPTPGGPTPGGPTPGGNPSVNPEPGTIALFGTGLVGLIGILRRRRQ
jgi:hypothetical protein